MDDGRWNSMPCLAAFAALARSKVTALIQGSDPLFTDRRKHIVALTISHRIPTMFFERELVIEGGLMTYAASFTDSVPAGRGLCREHPKGGQACRTSSSAADQVQSGLGLVHRKCPLSGVKRT